MFGKTGSVRACQYEAIFTLSLQWLPRATPRLQLWVKTSLHKERPKHSDRPLVTRPEGRICDDRVSGLMTHNSATTGLSDCFYLQMTLPRWPLRRLIQRKKILFLISSTDPAIVPKVLSQPSWLLKGLNVMLPQLVSRDTNPWELLCEGCLPLIPVTTVRQLRPSPRNSLSATCNVSQFLPCSLRPLLIHNLMHPRVF